MKIDKNLKKSIDKMVKFSFNESGVLLEKRATDCSKALKGMSGFAAILSLTYFLKGIKRELDKTTLTIESSSPLNPTQVKKVESFLKGKHLISQTKTNINKDLFGGIRVKIGDVVYDDSVSQKINQLRGVIHG